MASYEVSWNIDSLAADNPDDEPLIIKISTPAFVWMWSTKNK